MKKVCLIVGFFLFYFSISAQESEYFKGEVFVKVLPEYGNKCSKSAIAIPSIQKVIHSENISDVSKVFPNHQPLKTKSTNSSEVDLSTIYRLKFDPAVSPEKIIKRLKNDKHIAYVEPNYKNYLTFDPSDTLNSSQWYLDAINAYAAWDIQQGDTSVVIAFTDTGTDLDHPDLVDAYAYNYNDPINGIDDDNDGFIDNYIGWDVADDDNDPALINSGHGVNVAGIASAATNNVTGISGCGFNTKLLPVKIDQAATGLLTAAYEGIIYAADHGAFIISNSWGSFNYSQFAQDIVNYAAVNKGCLVICATGNNGIENRFYPAAYDNVLSVGSMTYNDIVKSNSNYGYWTDILAPGDDMLTTNAIGLYNQNGGTSMAAPVVAGIAALVKSQFPTYTREQVTEQILNTGENIYAVNDPKYNNKLGSGQLDAFRALTDSLHPGIKLINRKITDNNDSIFDIGDTLRISGDFKNFLKDATNASVTLSVIDNRLQVLNGTFNLGNLNSGGSVSIENNPFLLKINGNVNFNELVNIQLDIRADNYQKKQFLSVVVNSDYITVNENNLTVTLPSNGSIGFGGEDGSLGEGIKYLGGNSLLYEGSFMIGNSPSYVANKFRGESGSDDDFQIVSSVKPMIPILADYEATSTFDDGKLSASPVFKIKQNWYLFKNESAENSIIYEYIIENISGVTQNGVYAGIIMDWDIHDYSKNKITYDPSRKLAISYATDTNLYCGIRVLNNSRDNIHYAIDNVENNSGVDIIKDGFSDAEKFQVLSSSRDNAGEVTPEGNDIIDVNSVGPFNLDANEKMQLAFSIGVNSSKNLLQAESDTLQNLFNSKILNFTGSDKIELFPNPVRDRLQLRMKLAGPNELDISVYDISGKLVYRKNKLIFTRGIHFIQLPVNNLKTALYFLEIRGNNLLFQDKFVVANK